MVRIPGSHPPNIKNRSSKHLIKLTKVKSAIRSMSGELLHKYCKDSNDEFGKEISRRSKKNKVKHS